MRKRGLCYRPMSVRLSVAFVYCIQTAEDIVKLLSRPGKVNGDTPRRGIGVGAHLPVFGRWTRRWINHGVWRMASATPDLRLLYYKSTDYSDASLKLQGHWNLRLSTEITFPACVGTKFILLGDSWLPRILILWDTRLNSLDLTSHTGPGSYPGRYTLARPASIYLA